jgi:hypothetical protein
MAERVMPMAERVTSVAKGMKLVVLWMATWWITAASDLKS